MSADNQKRNPNDAPVLIAFDSGTQVVRGITIDHVEIPTVRFRGGATRGESVAVTNARMLDRAAIRRQLPAPPSRLRWHLRLTTFDLNSPKELPTTRLDARGLRAAEHALLARSPGGSSHLGPALHSVESTPFAGRRILVVLSDFELYDPNPVDVLVKLIGSSADTVSTIVFRAPPPAALIGTRVDVTSIDPHTSVAADIATHIVTTACNTFRQRPQPVRTEHALLDLIDDESGSMWSGNDAFFLRHEAALIAVEHLVAHPSPRTRRTARS
jgi:hypothetical protein